MGKTIVGQLPVPQETTVALLKKLGGTEGPGPRAARPLLSENISAALRGSLPDRSEDRRADGDNRSSHAYGDGNHHPSRCLLLRESQRLKLLRHFLNQLRRLHRPPLQLAEPCVESLVRSILARCGEQPPGR